MGVAPPGRGRRALAPLWGEHERPLELTRLADTPSPTTTRSAADNHLTTRIMSYALLYGLRLIVRRVKRKPRFRDWGCRYCGVSGV